MRAAAITQPNQTNVIDAPVPDVGSEDVLIQVHAAGICGTDVHILRGEYMAVYPLIPGHEFSGTVTSVGSAVTRYKIGDRVTADPNIPCNRCYYCQRNEPNQCRNLAAVGVTRNGAFADYVAVPEGNTLPIGNISFREAALVEPLACVVWGLKQVEIQPGDSVVIFGAGPMGCLLLQSVRRAGAADIVVVDTMQWRLSLAEQLGATHVVMADEHLETTLRQIAPMGFDIVTDATGISSVIERMFMYAKPRAKIWVFGVAPTGAKIEISPYNVFRNDWKIVGSFAVNRTFPQAIALIESGAIQVQSLISHELSIEEFARGMVLVQTDPRRMKIQFSWT